jgi:hypothetical protein
LKKAQRDSDEDLSDDEFDGSGKGGRTAEEKLKRSLFGDDEGMHILHLFFFPIIGILSVECLSL